MAIVYLARDLKHDREVAVKVLLPELAASIGGDRFEREIRLAAKLSHPHILALYDSGTTEDGLLFYVMPFVKGESLRDRLDRDGQLPIDDAIQITLEVAGALGHAHEQGIVHRDIKPENVLLQGGHALVADFGIARAASEGGGQKLTQTGMALGTPVYMAPEQAAGEKVGPSADLYSLGCMLYEMLAGEPPFTGKNAMAIMARHAMENVPSIRIVRSSVPEEVEDAIFAAMAKVPTDRPQTAADFSQLLGLPIGATASRRVALRHTASRRVPTLAGQAYEAPAPPPARPLWRRPLVWVGAVVVLGGAGAAAWKLAGGSPATPTTTGGLDPHSIAVLYFEDRSSDKQLAFLADGLTEGLIGTLGEVPGLSVVSKGGVETYRQTTIALDSVARALSAGTLIRGTVERDGDKIRVNVRLVEGGSGADYERTTVEQPATALLAVRDSLAGKVAELIRKRLGEEIKLQAQRHSTNSVAAWSLVQRAEQLRKDAAAAIAKDDSTARDRDFDAADSLLAAAEKEDGKWADPIALRARVAYQRSRIPGLEQEPAAKWIEAGIDHANRALAVNPKDPNALETRGNLQYWRFLLALEPDANKSRTLLLQAKADLEAATRINPTQAGAWASLSHLYYKTNGAVDVNIAARRALEADAFLDNAEAVLNRLFLSSYDLGQFTDAGAWCEATKRRFGGTVNANACELYLLATRAREPNVARAWLLADSVTALTAGGRREATRLEMNMLAAVVLARAGLGDSARRVIERSKGDAQIDPVRDVTLLGAFAYVELGDLRAAIEMLKVYFSANPTARSSYAADPGWQFKPLAENPEFRSLVETK
jgi:serine/threonine-protein kinase